MALILESALVLQAICRGVIASQRRVVGGVHPCTLQSLNTLARILDHQSRHEEAQTLYRDVFAVRNERLGPEHPDTLETRAFLSGDTPLVRWVARVA